MNTLSVIFFIYCLYGLGYSFTRFAKEGGLELNIIRFGVGLGLFPVVGLIFNLLHIPIDWKYFLIISSLFPAYDLIRNLKKFSGKFNLTFQKQILILFVIFISCAFVYGKGAFSYPWLEDDDPWEHAASSKYVSIERNVDVPSGELQYINPYPPGFAIIFGVLHQTNDSIYWTLKFFNAFIIALGILFFYVFLNEFTHNKRLALTASFILASLPCYLSHFIWAHAIVLTMLYPTLYCFLRAQDDKRFIVPASFMLAGILLTQPTQPIKFFIMLLFLLIISSCIKKKFQWSNLLAGVAAVLISLLWWLPVIQNTRKGEIAVITTTTVRNIADKGDIMARLTELFDPYSGTATRAYTFSDFLFPTQHNMINNPVGVGTTVSMLVLLGIFLSLYKYRSKNESEKIFALTALAWLLFTFLGVNSATFKLPVGLFAFRFWMLFAIPVALLAAETTTQIWRFIQKPFIKRITLTCILLSILLTSGYPKYQLNTATWPWGVYWNSHDELAGYLWLRKNLPPNTKVFSFSDNLLVIGHDMRADFWTKEYKDSFKDAIEMDLNNLHAALTKNGYRYIIIGQREVKNFGIETINAKLESLNTNNLFKWTYSAGNGAKIYKVL